MIPATWAQVRERLLPAIERMRGMLTEEGVLTGIAAGRLKLWEVGASALMTEIQQTDGPRVVVIGLYGGHMDDARLTREQVKEYGKKNGCTAVIHEGRSGWKRLFPKAAALSTMLYEEI